MEVGGLWVRALRYFYFLGGGTSSKVWGDSILILRAENVNSDGIRNVDLEASTKRPFLDADNR